MIKNIFQSLLLIISIQGSAQSNNEVLLMDFIKVKEGYEKEAMFFYENNWKPYRDLALKREIIKSYEILKAKPDSLNSFDLILITIYKDSAQFAKSEENFRPILKELRPNGPVLLNEKKPVDFRQSGFLKILRPIYSSSLKRKRK